jgi:hypothetical protein
MNSFQKGFFSCAVLAGVLAGCTKTTNPYFNNGSAPTLTASTTAIAVTPTDSNSTVLTLKWTDPKYATAAGTEKYTIQIDSSGRNFSQAVTFVVSGALSDTFLAKTINDVALGFGGAFGVPINVDVRVMSSYANNNEQLLSNALTISVTPYKTPPKVQPPSSGELFIIGSATAGGWNNPVPALTQQFTQLDSVTYQGSFYIIGGGAYDFLPVNGSWSTKYNVASSQTAGLAQGGSFQYVTGGGSDIPAPAMTGIYTIKVNFQTGLYTITPSQLYGVYYVPGNYQGWTPGTAATLASIQRDGKYEGYVDFTALGGFKVTNEGDWSGTIYGDTSVKTGNSGILTTSGGGNNMQVASTGIYLLQMDTAALTWSPTPIAMWGLIGDFNGWAADVPMTLNAGTLTWTGTISPASAGGFKIRANGAWTLSYGTGGPGGSLTSNAGGNIPITAGSHTITLNLSIPGYYTVSIQ